MGVKVQKRALGRTKNQFRLDEHRQVRRPGGMDVKNVPKRMFFFPAPGIPGVRKSKRMVFENIRNKAGNTSKTAVFDIFKRVFKYNK